MGKVDNTIAFSIRKHGLVAIVPLKMALPQINLPCDGLSKRILPYYEFSLITPMFLHLCILTLFGFHESSVAWLKPLSCLLLFKGKPLFSVSSIKTSSISFHHTLYCFEPMLKIFLKKNHSCPVSCQLM